MKISLVTETFPPDVNGVAMTLSRLSGGLAALGHEVLVVRPNPRGEMPAAFADPPWSEVRVPGLPIPQYPEAQVGLPSGNRLRRIWSYDRPDIVHIATEGVLGCSARNAARDLDIPLITSFHTNFHDYAQHYGVGMLEPIVAAYLRWFHRAAQLTLVPDRGLIAELRELGLGEMAYFGRGVDSRLFDPARRDPALRAEWGAGPDDPVVVHVSRVAAEKNIPQVIEGYRRARASVPNLRLVVVGDGPTARKLQRRNPDVLFAGMRHDEDLARHYASGDLFYFASDTETFGNVVMEAMASGLVVLGYDYAAVHQYIVNGQNGCSVPLGDADAWLESAERLAREFSTLGVMREAARLTALQVPWEEVLRHYVGNLQAVRAAYRPVAEGTAAADLPSV